MAGNYFASLAAPEIRNALVDLSPINNALDQNALNNFRQQQMGLQTRAADRADQELKINQGQFGLQQDAAKRQQVADFGRQATAVDQLSDPNQRSAAWRSILAKHGTDGLTPEELDPVSGPKLMAAQAGQFLDPLDRETKQAQLGLIKAQTAAANQKIDPYDLKEVNGALVRVPKRGGAAEVIYQGGPDPTKLPQGYRYSSDGQSLEPVPGGPADKLTEGESKDALFAERLLRSDSEIEKIMKPDEKGNITGYNPTANINNFIPDSGIIANLINSDNWKKYQQAAREGLASILRKDTGAAVTPDEFRLYFPTYYPQPGDDAQTILQKKAARARFAEGLRGASSRAFNRMYPGYDQNSPVASVSAAAAAPSSAPVRVNSVDDALKLPSGTQFMTPDGRLKVRP